MRIDRTRLEESMQALGRIGATAKGGLNRVALTDDDRRGRDLLVGWMREAGLTVTVDQMGNIFGQRAGEDGLPPVMIGSHADSVPTGGKYDGQLGVLCALETIRTLNDEKIRTRYPVAMAIFTNEEGARFQPDMMGSLVYTGALPLERALPSKAIDGPTVGDELSRIGYAGEAPVARPRAHAYVELHVEQGPVLDAEGVKIGAVESVQGISWTELTLTGQSNHAGTTPMALRHDAGYVAAEIAVFARRLAKELGGHQVATVGMLNVAPNLVNVVPNRVVMTVDLRNTDEARLQEAERRVLTFAEETARAEGVGLARRSLARFEPVAFDAALVARVEAIARELGLSVKRLPSGAGHDAQILAAVCPACMIFVPSRKGVSHNVEEYTAPEDLAAGASVLLRLVGELAS